MTDVIMHTEIHNNDVGTLFVFMFYVGLCCLFYEHINGGISKKSLCGIIVVVSAFCYQSPPRFFATIHKHGIVTVKKTFFYDSRMARVSFYIDDNNRIQPYNHATGANNLYLLTEDNEIYNVEGNMIPPILSMVEPGLKVHISSWKFLFFEYYYSIYNIKIIDLKE